MKKTVFITGASSGFGKYTVKLFHQQGWNVVATMRSPEKETELSALDGVLLTKLDVTDKRSINDAVQAAIDTFGQIDVLVNNAGFGTLGALEAATDEVIRQQFDVNFFGLIDVTKAVLPGMRTQRGGIIINVSSMGGKVAFPFSTLYNATKFALEGLSESLQYEVNPFGIQVKIVEPGGYKTDFAGRSMGYFGGAGIEGYQRPFDRFAAKLSTWPMSGNIGEVAQAIYKAATDGTPTLRYPVGQDAIPMLQARHQMDDVAFKTMIAGQTGI